MTYDMSYTFYELSRFILMTSFLLIARFEYLLNSKHILWIIWVSFSFLINPFLKIGLPKDFWVVIDLLIIMILLLSFVNQKSINEFLRLKPISKFFYVVGITCHILLFLILGIMTKPKTTKYYIDAGYTKSYAQELANNSYQNLYLSISCFIVLVLGIILIVRTLRVKNDTKN